MCVGNLSIDETIQDGVRSETSVGGDALYAALAARLFLKNVRMFAVVGTDFPGDVLHEIRTAGVRADELPHRDVPTLRYVVRYRADGSRVWEMKTTDEELERLSVYPSDVPRSMLAADGVMLAAMSLRSQFELIKWLREHSSTTIYLDLQEDYIAGNAEAILQLVESCDVFLPSEVEAVALAETRDLAEAARFFASHGPKTVVIKCAERGCVVFADDVVNHVPVEAVTPTDSTGAGDAFCGAFAAVHLITRDALRAAEAGSRAARLAVEAFGTAGLLAELTVGA